MSEFPSDWKIETLGDACEIHDSKRIPLSGEQRRERKGLYPYYGANNIQDSIDDFIFDFDAVLLAEDGGYYDEYATRDIAQYATGKYWVNNHAHILTGKKYVDTKFLYYSLVRKNICPWINTGTRAKLNQADLRQIEIAIPPLAEQRRIAETLTGIDEQINKLIIKEQHCLQILRAIALDAFANPSADRSTLGELAEFRGGRAFKSGELTETGIKITRISNLHKPDFPYWRYSGHFNPKILAKDGDILFSWAGVANSINVHRYKGEDTLLNQHIYNFKFKNELIKEWTYWVLKNMLPSLRKQIEGGAGQLHLTKGFIQAIEIPVIEAKAMSSLCDSFRSAESLVNLLRRKKYKLDLLKCALSNDLLAGRKRVSV